MISPPFHENLQCANTTSFWAPFDTEERWHINMRDTSTRNLLTKLGYADPTAITYTYNSHGFRDEEFDNRSCGIAFGCSFTHGTGIKQNQTWPCVLGNLLDTHVWNLGIGGASLDTVFRISEYYINLLEPEFVSLLIPPSTRFEYYEYNRYAIATLHDYNESDNKHFFKQWFANQENTQNHQHKNLLALEKVCDKYGIEFVSLCPLDDWPNKNSRARDLAHPDAESNSVIAEQFANLLNPK